MITNAIAEYLPDEQTGKPSSLPTLVCSYMPASTMTTSRICCLVVYTLITEFDMSTDFCLILLSMSLKLLFVPPTKTFS